MENKTHEIDATSIENLVHSSMVSSKLAKLISSKNINVKYSSEAKTASVSLSTRTITFPYLGNMTNYDTHMLFLGHEVAHLLYSTQEMLDKMYSSNTEFTYFNIVLDIRDERKFKEEYPGFVKNFVKGYQNLLAEDFFGSKQNLCFRTLSNRLNAYAKLGHPANSFIPMSSEELEFYDLCMKAESYDDILKLSAELKLLDSKSKKDLAHKIRNAAPEDVESLMSEFLESSEDDDDEAIQELSEEQVEKLLEELSKDAEELKDSANSKNLIQNFNVVTFDSFKKDQKSKIVSSETFVKGLKDKLGSITQETASLGRDVKSLFKRSVDHMSLEFESKKAAFRDANRKLSKDGNLDVNRIALYQVSEEIFRTKIKVGNSKNHGVVLMLDASGSIQKMFRSLVEQVITLSEFCRKVNIPFKVYLFGAEYQMCDFQDYTDRYRQVDDHPIGRPTLGAYLIEVLNSEQSLADYNLAIYALYNQVGFSFGGTPLVSGILTLEDEILKLFERNQIQSKKLIIVTDGGPTDVSSTIAWSRNNIWVYDKETRKGFLDAKDVEFRAVDIMAKVLKNRYGIETMILAVADSVTDLKRMRGCIQGVNNFSDAERSVIREFGFLENSTYHNSPVVYIKATSAEVDDFDIDVDSSDTVNKIKAKFSKKFNTIKKSKVLLNTLVSHLVF